MTGFTPCTAVGSGASVPLYQEVTEFTPALNPDFGNPSFTPFELDSGIVTSVLGADGAPQYARNDGNTSTTTGALMRSRRAPLDCVRCYASQVMSMPSLLQHWPSTPSTYDRLWVRALCDTSMHRLLKPCRVWSSFTSGSWNLRRQENERSWYLKPQLI